MGEAMTPDSLREIEKLRPLLEKCLKYFNHVKGWSTHGPASISTEELAEEISAALNLVQPAQVEEVASPYRILEKGEIIQEGDEYDACSNPWKDKAIWKPAPSHLIGKPVSDPAFPAHTLYRRKKEKYSPPPTPTRAPALEALIEDYEGWVRSFAYELSDHQRTLVSAARKEAEGLRQVSTEASDWDQAFCDELVKAGIATKCDKHDKNCIPHVIAEIVRKLRDIGRGTGIDVRACAEEIMCAMRPQFHGPFEHGTHSNIVSILSRHLTPSTPPPTITQGEMEKIADEATLKVRTAQDDFSINKIILSALQRVVGREKKG